VLPTARPRPALHCGHHLAATGGLLPRHAAGHGLCKQMLVVDQVVFVPVLVAEARVNTNKVCGCKIMWEHLYTATLLVSNSFQ
jgi:hypothetical protein